jgi:hypothetical protein
MLEFYEEINLVFFLANRISIVAKKRLFNQNINFVDKYAGFLHGT